MRNRRYTRWFFSPRVNISIFVRLVTLALSPPQILTTVDYIYKLPGPAQPYDFIHSHTSPQNSSAHYHPLSSHAMRSAVFATIPAIPIISYFRQPVQQIPDNTCEHCAPQNRIPLRLSTVALGLASSAVSRVHTESLPLYTILYLIYTPSREAEISSNPHHRHRLTFCAPLGMQCIDEIGFRYYRRNPCLEGIVPHGY